MQLRQFASFIVIVTAWAAMGCAHSGSTEVASGKTGQVLYLVPNSDATLPIGVFDRRDVLMAFYGSAYSVDVIRKLRAERDEAAKRGDSARVKELEAEGVRLQEVAHQQMAGKAPLTNVSEALRGELPQIAAQNGVREIVVAGSEAKGAATVNVTAAIVKLLPRSEYVGQRKP